MMFGKRSFSSYIKQTTLQNNVKLQVCNADITMEWVDAIVNAANSQLRHGGGLAAAVVRNGGR